MKTSTDTTIHLEEGEVALVLNDKGAVAYMPESRGTKTRSSTILLATLCALIHPSTPEMQELIEKAIDLTIKDMVGGKL